MNLQEITQKWELDEPKYQELGKLVSSFIKKNIPEIEILPEISHRTKDLLSIIKKIRKKEREKEYDYSHLNDKLGIRIICSFQNEMSAIDEFLHKYFDIVKVERKKETLDVKTLDYISNHYDAKIKTSIKEFKNYDQVEDLTFEIQVRTLNQHAWANAAHSLSYKQDAEIPQSYMRKIYRLLSLYEIADDEFSIVNEALLKSDETKVYSLLRKLEGKTYKYAQIDFDRDTAIFAIQTILGYLNEAEISKVQKEIEQFIETNSKKIQKIFDSNRDRFAQVAIITQPEIFLIWFCLEFFPYSLTDNWNNDFDEEELEQAQTLWGKEVK